MAKTMKQRCSERPLCYMPKTWWMLTNYGNPLGVFTRRGLAIDYAEEATGKKWKDTPYYELRKVRVAVPR